MMSAWWWGLEMGVLCAAACGAQRLSAVRWRQHWPRALAWAWSAQALVTWFPVLGVVASGLGAIAMVRGGEEASGMRRAMAVAAAVGALVALRVFRAP